MRGCGTCADCARNQGQLRETGVIGSRRCTSAPEVNHVVIEGSDSSKRFRVEYPRALLVSGGGAGVPSHKRRGHTATQLAFVRKLGRFTLDNIIKERVRLEKKREGLESLSLRLNDVHELTFPPDQHKTGTSTASRQQPAQPQALDGPSAPYDDAYVDTDIVHVGTTQRVAVRQVRPIVAAALRKSYTTLDKLEQLRLAMLHTMRRIAGFHAVRIARGFHGRLAARQHRRGVIRELAATRIQAATRGYRDRRDVVPVLWREFLDRKATMVQAAWRGFVVWRWYTSVVKAALTARKRAAAIAFQAAWRGHCVRSRMGEIADAALARREAGLRLRAERLERAKARKEATAQASALLIQRVWRGVVGRRGAYARRRVTALLHPRVKALADEFLASGDLWGFLQRVEDDYRRAEAAKTRDVARATAYVDQVMRLRRGSATHAGTGDGDDARARGAGPTPGSARYRAPGTATARRGSVSSAAAAVDEAILATAPRRGSISGPLTHPLLTHIGRPSDTGVPEGRGASAVGATLPHQDEQGFLVDGSQSPCDEWLDGTAPVGQRRASIVGGFIADSHSRTLAALRSAGTGREGALVASAVYLSGTFLDPKQPTFQQLSRSVPHRRGDMPAPMPDTGLNEASRSTGSVLLDSHIGGLDDTAARIMHQENFECVQRACLKAADTAAMSADAPIAPTVAHAALSAAGAAQLLAAAAGSPLSTALPAAISGASGLWSSIRTPHGRPDGRYGEKDDQLRGPWQPQTEVQGHAAASAAGSPGASRGAVGLTTGDAPSWAQLPPDAPPGSALTAYRGSTAIVGAYPAHLSGGAGAATLLSEPEAPSGTVVLAPRTTPLPPVALADRVFAEEALLRAHGVSLPTARDLLRDVHGLDGPLDMLIYHAVLRCAPLPAGILEAAESEGLLGAEDAAQMRRRSAVATGKDIAGAVAGTPLPGAPLPPVQAMYSTASTASGDSSSTAADKGRQLRQLVSEGKAGAAGSVASTSGGERRSEPMRAVGAGELAVRLYRELPRSLVTLQWERSLHEAAAPITARLRAAGARVVRDLQRMDLLAPSVGLDPLTAAMIRRLLAIVSAASKVTVPSVIKSLYETAPPEEGKSKRMWSSLRKPVKRPVQFSLAGALVSTRSGDGGVVPRSAQRDNLIGLMWPATASASALTGSSFSTVLAACPLGRNSTALVPVHSAVAGGGRRYSYDNVHNQPLAQVEGCLADSDYGAASASSFKNDTGSTVPAAIVPLAESLQPRVPYSNRWLFCAYGVVCDPVVQATPDPDQLPSSILLPPGSVTLPTDDFVRIDLLCSQAVHDADARYSVRLERAQRRLAHIERLSTRSTTRQARQDAYLREFGDGSSIAAEDGVGADHASRDHDTHLHAAILGVDGPPGADTALESSARPATRCSSRSELRRVESELRAATAGLAQLSPPDARYDALHALLCARLAVVKSSLHERLFSLDGKIDLGAGVELAVVQAAFTLPLPSPRLAEMVDTRCNRKQREFGDDITARTAAPYDEFLTHLALLPPLRELVTERAEGMASDDQAAERELRSLTRQPQVLAGRAAAALANLPTKCKHRLLIAERARTAAAVAPPWVDALSRWGFVRLGLLPRVPASELQAALASAYPIRPARGAPLAELRLRGLADSVPPEGIAHALASTVAFWLAGSPEVQARLQSQTSTYDSRFQQGPADPRGLVPARRPHACAGSG